MPEVKRVMLVGVDGMQLCQVQQFAREGALPNFARLLAMGSAGELLPELPAWTPTNWGTIATGALPGSTMLAGWHRRRDDDPEGKWDVSTFSSRAWPVEAIWESAERAGLRTLSVFYPGTWPPKVEKGMVVAPLYSGPGIIPLDIARGGVWTTSPETVGAACMAISPRAEGDCLVADVAIAPSPIELAKEYNFGDKPDDAREGVAPGKRVPLRVAFDVTARRAELFDKQGKRICDVQLGEWSEWVQLDFGARGLGTVRFMLFSSSPDAEYGLTLAHSAIYPTRGFTAPDEFGEELIEHVGPFIPSPIHLPGPRGDGLAIDEYAYQGMWMARVAQYLLETRGWDLYYQHYHVVDSATHRHLNGADPEGGGYDPAAAHHHVDMMRKAYQAADEMLGVFVEMMDDRTALIVISDHGNIPNKWVVDYARVLEGAGLLAYDESGIQWDGTRAFMIPQRITDVYVNLKDRYPQGTVDPEDYETVQEEIIDALLDLRNPDGKRVVAYALKKKDAQVVNYYGPEAGDVMFVFNSFHGRARLPKGVPVRRATQGANHGPQIATTRTEFSSDLASAIIAGPGIRKGYIRDGDVQGLWRLIDVVPTVAHMLGFAPPRDSRGGVMYDVFE